MVDDMIGSMIIPMVVSSVQEAGDGVITMIGDSTILGDDTEIGDE